MHHSFDILLAEKYGVEEAILIHHFQHWIRFNRQNGSNYRDGKTWTYQTRKEMAAHFTYWGYDKVKYLCEKLVSLGVLETNNFNKKGFDKTLWYAFVNEEQMIGIKKSFTKGKNALGEGKSALSMGKSAQPIPNTIQDAKQDKLFCALSPLVSASPAVTEPWDKIQKIDSKGNKFFISRQDLVTRAILAGKNWSLDEIQKCWECVVDYEHPLNDWFAYCEGIMKNFIAKKNIQNLREKGKEWKKTNHQKEKEKEKPKEQSESSKNETSKINTLGQPFLNSKFVNGVPQSFQRT
jgi:hypothetical protein